MGRMEEGVEGRQEERGGVWHGVREERGKKGREMEHEYVCMYALFLYSWLHIWKQLAELRQLEPSVQLMPGRGI